MERKRLVLVAVAAFTVIGLYFATQAYFNPAYTMRPGLGELVAVNLVYYYLWALLTPLVVFLAFRYPLAPGKWRRSLLVHAGASILLTAMQIAAAEAIIRPFSTAVYRVGKPYLATLRIAFGANYHGSLPTYWVIVAVCLAARYYRNAARLEAQLSRAQLDALKMQLNPHFLFNTLNSISSLMYTDVDAADAMLARLSDLLRLTLDRPLEQEISLEEELDLIRRYLDIERIRFEEQLRVDIDVERGSERALVPSLALQPLVENAIHHGIAKRTSGGTIEIRARRDGDALHLSVRDDGDQAEREIKERVGLANTRARLQQLYGDAASFTYGPHPSGGFAVALTIPFRT